MFLSLFISTLLNNQTRGRVFVSNIHFSIVKAQKSITIESLTLRKTPSKGIKEHLKNYNNIFVLLKPENKT